MTKMIYKTFYAQPLSKIIFLMFFLVLVWSKLENWFTVNSGKEKIWKIGNTICWLSMIFAILGVTLSSRDASVVEVQWKPFYSFELAKEQPEIYRSMLMNVFMFFPLGLTLPYVLPKRWKGQTLITILFAFLFSIAIEFLQYHFQIGRAEVDDVICNTFGGIIGTLGWHLEKLQRKRTMKDSK